MSYSNHKGVALVTGARGFVGRAVCACLLAAGYAVRAAVRTVSSPSDLPYLATVEEVLVPDLGHGLGESPLLHGVDVVVHLAARTHVLTRSDGQNLARYRHVNLNGTRRLAEAAVQAAVRRFVYMSSIKVNGEATMDRPYTEADAPAPRDAYGLSKWEAEQALLEIGRASSMEIVILRPPLVYGPHVKGNLLGLLRALDRHVPLPLAAIRNRRSLIYVGNLADATLRCIESSQAAGKTYLVADGEEVSTPELVRRIAAALDVTPLLFPCPGAWLDAAGWLFGKREQVRRLRGSLRVDSSKIRGELGWQPPCALDAGLREMAGWYRKAYR